MVEFALSESARQRVTPAYSFTLAANFQPQRDYAANIRAVRQPGTVVAGTQDESFRTEQLETMFRSRGQDRRQAWPAKLLPGVGHIPLTTDPAAVQACVEAVDALRKSAP